MRKDPLTDLRGRVSPTRVPHSALVPLSLVLAGAAFAQNASIKKTLVVNARTADAAAVQIDGIPVILAEKYATEISEAKAAGALLR